MGKLRLFALVFLFLAAAACHILVAVYLANDEAGDSKVYKELAENVVTRGVYSTETEEPFQPSLIRTPGYPLFLAGIYELFGIGNDTAVRIVQALLYTFTCLFAGLIASSWIDTLFFTKEGCEAGVVLQDQSFSANRALLIAFLLSALCPFTAIYSATILSETPTMFLLATSVLAATYGFKYRKRSRTLVWFAIAGIAAGVNVLVRPDAGLFAFGIGLAIVFSVLCGGGFFSSRIADRSAKGIVFSLAFILPLVPWTIRNEKVFGLFQPLSPTHAEMPGEFVPHGYYKWVRTWIDDEAYIDPTLWELDQKPLKIDDMPAYAFSSNDEKQQVAELFDEYNNSDPEHPAGFSQTSDSKDENSIDENNQPSDDDSTDSGEEDSDDKSDQSSDDSDDQGSGESQEEDQTWDLKISPELDAKFDALANERIARDPWCYYICLPAKRSASMWFDTHSDWYPFNGELFPLTEMDLDKGQQYWLPLFAGINVIFTFLSFAGLFALRKARSWLWLFLVLAVTLPRIIFFGTLENPEPRYFVELFIPAAILGGVFLARMNFRWKKKEGSLI